MAVDKNPMDLIKPGLRQRRARVLIKNQILLRCRFLSDKILANTYRVVLEVFVSPYDNDEPWFGNPPNAYIELNRLPTKWSHNAYREILTRLDKNNVSSTIPFQVIYGGRINPLFWDPLATIC